MKTKLCLIGKINLMVALMALTGGLSARAEALPILNCVVGAPVGQLHTSTVDLKGGERIKIDLNKRQINHLRILSANSSEEIIGELLVDGERPRPLIRTELTNVYVRYETALDANRLVVEIFSADGIFNMGQIKEIHWNDKVTATLSLSCRMREK